MKHQLQPDTIHQLIRAFSREAKAELDERWQKWKIDYVQLEVHEVVGALLARQVTLATALVESPALWNWSTATVILRPMTEVFLNLKWILQDPVPRAQAFVAHGLGQMKLRVEHLKTAVSGAADEFSESIEETVKSMQAWIDSQLYSFFVEVNLGAWADNQRDMANDVDELDFYNDCYTPYSAGIHSSWHHVGVYNVKHCTNPLHRFHKIPHVPDCDADIHFVLLAAKYLDMVFRAFDEKTGIKCESPPALKGLITRIKAASPVEPT